jgi:hypothetical protein
MGFEPKKITEDNVIRAVERIKNESIALRPSTKYNVLIDNVEYPPKEIMRYAHEDMNGEHAWDLPGGEPTNKWLRDLGFEITGPAQIDPIIKLLSDYKNHISKTKLKDEVYKWEMVEKFNGRPNINAEDFQQEISQLKFGNLVYAMGIAVINHITKERPEEVRDEFNKLQRSDVDLDKRVTAFNANTLNIYRGIGQTLGHHQDERTIATYLTLFDDTKYTFYKNSYYAKYCKYLGVKSPKKNKKYSHYLTLLNELIDNYISKDEELIAQVKSLIPSHYDGTNHLLLAQDILYQMFDQVYQSTYWVFQGNPDKYDFKSALIEGNLDTWTVSAHRELIAKGDKVIMWITGSNAGCYALAEVTEDPSPRDQEQNEFWKVDDKSDFKAGITITHNLISNPVTKQEIENVKTFKNFNGGNQGTNFTSNKKEYDKFLELIHSKSKTKYWLFAPGEGASRWDEFFDTGIMGLGWDELGDLNMYSSKQAIVEELQRIENTTGSKKNDATANYDFKEVIAVGDIIIPKKGRQDYLGYGIVESSYYYDETRDKYRSCRKVKWMKKGVWPAPKSDIVLKTLTDITKYPEYVERLIKLIGIETEEDMPKEASKKEARNVILYGPPGTGKTHFLQKNYIPRFTDTEASITKEDFFLDIINQYSWWEVIAAVLKDIGTAKVTDILTHELLQYKVKVSSSSSVRPTIWGQLQTHSHEDCTTVNLKLRREPFLFWKNEDSTWDLKISEEEPHNFIELYEKHKNFTPLAGKTIKRYVFTTFHQSYGYEQFIEGIKPITTNGEMTYEVVPGLFAEMVDKAKASPKKDFAIFIDEINRGNVSQIFGELITLIEDDKREGQENQITVKLPYSGRDLTVPSNLFLIGTMNTADRSVEALDTALRRRFSFVEMLPCPALLSPKAMVIRLWNSPLHFRGAWSDNSFRKEADSLYSLLGLRAAFEQAFHDQKRDHQAWNIKHLDNITKDDFSGLNLENMLLAINNRIEVLIDRDHTIGHAYFMSVNSLQDLKSVFADKIVPLLQEYFYGDYSKMELVIGTKFFSKKAVDTVSFAIESDDAYEGDVYEIIGLKALTDEQFIAVIQGINY